MVTDFAMFALIIPGDRKRDYQKWKPQVEAISGFIDFCPTILIQCSKLYYFILIFGWWLSIIILDMNENILCWYSGPVPQQAGCMETIWTPTSPYPNEAPSYWGMNLPQSQTIVDFGADCCTLFCRQAVLAAHSPDPINSSRHIMAETSVVKQPYVVAVLATSAGLNHWWGCNPFKCWSHIYVLQVPKYQILVEFIRMVSQRVPLQKLS